MPVSFGVRECKWIMKAPVEVVGIDTQPHGDKRRCEQPGKQFEALHMSFIVPGLS